MYFDTHAHYDDEQFEDDRDAIIEAVNAAGVDLIVNPGCNMKSSFMAVELAEKYPYIYAAAGIHPENADEYSQENLLKIEKLLENPKVVALGEVGLDYHYDFVPRELQKQALHEQLEIAEKAKLPVIIHDREAHEDCVNIVLSHPNVTGVFHCFSGSREMAQRLVEKGWYLSFTGAITFKNARKALETIKWMPQERIMIETDSPYLTPVPNRGKRNDSRNLEYIADTVGKIIGQSREYTAALTMENGKRFFGIK